MVATERTGEPGLRERKKLRTRQEISDVATRLFAEHGFEQVTLSQIAAAADVSVKTIFNHFGSKEELYFDRTDEVRASLVATIAERPSGVTVLEALRRLLTDNLGPLRGHGWDGIDDPEGFERLRRFLATQEASPALRARRRTIGEELVEELVPVLASELDRRTDDDAVAALAAMLVAALDVRDRVLRAAVAARLPGQEVRRRVVEVVDASFARLAAAFADVDRPR